MSSGAAPPSFSVFSLRFKLIVLTCLSVSRNQGLGYYYLLIVNSFCVAALIPLAEFSDVARTYGVSPDKETIEILTQAANHRGVWMCRGFVLFIHSHLFSVQFLSGSCYWERADCLAVETAQPADRSLCKGVLRRPGKEAVRSSRHGPA